MSTSAYRFHSIEADGPWTSPPFPPADRRHIVQGVIGGFIMGRPRWAEDLEGTFLYGLDAKGKELKAAPTYAPTPTPKRRGKNKPKTPCDSFEPCHGNYACCIHAASTSGTMEHKIATAKTPAQLDREIAASLAKPRGSSHATIATRDYEYVVYPEATHRHADRAVKVPMRRVGGSLRTYDLTDAKGVAKQMGPPAAIYSVSKGRFVGYVHPSGRYVAFR